MSTPLPPMQSIFADESSLRDWPHSPAHRLSLPGAYIVTAGTYQKQKHFNTPALLTRLTNLLLNLAEAHSWMIQAWAVFPNHYHFIAESQKPETLRRLVRELHSCSALELNRQQNAAGRKVWFQYWESQLTFHRSFLARLNYVHQNPVRHGLVLKASQYKWCSAGWFERKAAPAFLKTVASFPIDRLDVPDDFGDLLAP
ncbi:MAG: transposase [Candidatus Acidiferrum sp.]